MTRNMRKELNLTLWGKTNKTKINILPRWVYIFHSLPVQIPKSFFNWVKTLISSFYREGGKKRENYILRNNSMYRAGRLESLNLLIYKDHSVLKKIIFWITESHHEKARCFELEENCAIMTLQSFLILQGLKTHVFLRALK